MEEIIKDSVSYRSDKIPPYLCSVYAYITDKLIPLSLKGIQKDVLYFVYGGRADAVYNDTHPLTSDWDILFKDRTDSTLIPRFAKSISIYIEKKVNSKFSHVGDIKVIFKNKDYVSEMSRGRYTVCLVDPYMPYEKTYDCIDISGCHETGSSEYANYCDVFDTRRYIEQIYYASPEFIISETIKVIRGERKSKLESDIESLKEAIENKQNINKKVEDDEEITIEDVDTLENFEDIIDKYISSFVKLNRTEKRKID